MELLDVMNKRISDGTPLTKEEFFVLKTLLQLGKVVTKEKVLVGQTCKVPTNPYTGKEYRDSETAKKLAQYMEDIPEYIGQFAGKKQWEYLGRKVASFCGDEAVSVAEFKYMGKVCKIYAFEDTVPI